MGRRGPRGQSLAERAARGDPGKRGTRDSAGRDLSDSPALDQLAVAPEPPKGLQPLAREHWREVAPILVSRRHLTQADLPMLAALCDAWADYRRCRKVLDGAGGFTYESVNAKGGEFIAPRPEVGIAQKAEATYERLSRRFGLTPLDRQDVKAPAEPPKEDPGERHLRRRGLSR